MPSFARWLSLGFLALISSWSSAQIGDSLGIDPFKDYKTLETTHFRVTYATSERMIARKFADHLEEAHALLSPYLRWSPKLRTQVLVLDPTDTANGLTTPVGRFGIVFYSVPPESWFSTRYYDDWVRMLAIHEYAHYLNMDTTRGLWQSLRLIFGDVLLPNSLLPAWMLEGFAVYAETKFSRGGRGRSPYYRMLGRAAAEENLLDQPDYLTLDRVNGPNPYPPGGETAYAFGYFLMNEAAKAKAPGPTHDGEDQIEKSDDALGLLSYRSGLRVPFFINGNLENITGKTWPDLWDQWVKLTRETAKKEREILQAQKVSGFDLLTDPAQEVLGSALSPDGRLLAYVLSSPDEQMALFVRDLSTGEVRRISKKMLGARIAFSPDSSRILTSELRRRGGYTFHSDLIEVEVASGKRRWLSDGWRARDPQLSADGSWAVFTVLRDSTTHLARAAVTRDERGRAQLGPLEILHSPAPLDAIHDPTIDASGTRIAFTLHRNGEYSEGLYELKLGNPPALLAGGAFHSHPTYSSEGEGQGELFYVSDLSGIDNLYRYDSKLKRGVPITNVTTGLAFPTLGPNGEIYAALYRGRGWTLSRVERIENLKSLPQIEKAEALGLAPESIGSQATSATGEERNYSVFPSLWPRQWAPLVLATGSGGFYGGQVFGFDALERFSYLLGGGYDTWSNSPNWYGMVSNRSFGVTLRLYSYGLTEDIELSPPTRHIVHGATASYPFQFTRSLLVPSLGFEYERYTRSIPGSNPADNDIVYRSRNVPIASGSLLYSTAETTTLGISAEDGFTTVLGGRAYIDTLRGLTTYKGLLTHEHYLKVSSHSVIVPSLKASMSSRRSDYLDANVLLSGSYSDRISGQVVGAGLGEIGIRGYPEVRVASRSAVVGALDFRFPLARIFRGWSTHPAYLENLHGFVFGEASYLPSSSLSNKALPAAGGGLILETDLFYLPIRFSVEYARGFREEFGGDHEVLVQIAGPGLPF